MILMRWPQLLTWRHVNVVRMDHTTADVGRGRVEQ